MTRIGCCLLLMLMCCAGCAPAAPQVSPSNPHSGATASDKTAAAPSQNAGDDALLGRSIGLRVGSWKDLEEFVAAQRGKVVVVNVWSTTCGTCREKFPGFVKFCDEFAARGVVCVSFDCDYDGIPGKPPEYYRERVLTFLTSRGATMENFLSTEAFIDLIDPPAELTFPLALVYGRDGERVKRFDNEDLPADRDPFTYADVAKFVETLLD